MDSERNNDLNNIQQLNEALYEIEKELLINRLLQEADQVLRDIANGHIAWQKNGSMELD